MDLITDMEMYVRAYKSAEATLDELADKATDIRSRYDSLRAERESLGQEIANHERSVAALRGERESLKGEHAEASFADDRKELERIAGERTNIEQRINKHHKDIRAVREKLEALSVEELELEAATAAVEVDKCVEAVPVVFGMLNAPTNVARNELKSRASTIKGTLPAYTDAVRKQVDAEYRRKQQQQAATLARAEAQRIAEEQKANQTVRAVVDQDSGNLLGYDVYEGGEKVRFAPVKRVPVAQ